MSEHKFSIYSDVLPRNLKKSQEVTIENVKLLHRLIRVLKIQPDSLFIIFNNDYNVELKVKNISKNKITCRVINFAKNKPLLPRMHWILPILEKKALEEAILNLAVLGTTSIYPIVTKKAHRKDLYEGERSRLKQIMISALEQSKQFILPQIMPVNSLENTLNNLLKMEKTPKIFFDPGGKSCFKLIKILKNKKQLTNIICMVGPEGDLTDDEKEVLKKNNFDFYSLTKPILRSQLAAIIAAGIFRSFLN